MRSPRLGGTEGDGRSGTGALEFLSLVAVVRGFDNINQVYTLPCTHTGCLSIPTNPGVAGDERPRPQLLLPRYATRSHAITTTCQQSTSARDHRVPDEWPQHSQLLRAEPRYPWKSIRRNCRLQVPTLSPSSWVESSDCKSWPRMLQWLWLPASQLYQLEPSPVSSMFLCLGGPAAESSKRFGYRSFRRHGLVERHSE